MTPPRRRNPPWRAPGAIGILLLLVVSGSGQFGPVDTHSPGETAEATPEAAVLAPRAGRAVHLAELGVDRWHASGYRGSGVPIAVVDTGFRGYRRFLGNVLPATVITRSFRNDGDLEARDSQHGVLCAEVLHTLAPEAPLLLANWQPDQPASFLDAVRWARDQGARIISCSVIMPSWSDGEGGGPVHAALKAIVGSGGRPSDLLLFASAGNLAQRHWSGAFGPDSGGRHQWLPGRIHNTLRPWGHERVAVEVYGPGAADIDVCVRDASSHQPVGAAATVAGPGVPSGARAVRFDPEPEHCYEIEALAGDGSERSADRFHLVVLGAWLTHANAAGSIPFPGDGEEILTVGAVDSEGARLGYSSCGPNSRKPKPDLVARVPFPTLCRERPFSGTSAAAPQAAGLAALWWSRHPDWTADKVRQALHRHAQDLGPPGHDFETGLGLIRLP